MLKLLEFMSSFYWPLLPETILKTFVQTRRRQKGSIAGDLARSVVGSSTSVFFVPINGLWDGYRINKLLNHFGIPAWGWVFYNGQVVFHVHKADANLAARVMTAAGVELL